MHREPVESETIASIGYDCAFKVLELEFRETGEVYLYFDVPLAEHEAFLSAPSKGTYLNRTFKPRGYRYESVPKPAA